MQSIILIIRYISLGSTVHKKKSEIKNSEEKSNIIKKKEDVGVHP